MPKNMEKESINAIAEIPTTHFFVYKEKQYPFNIDLFKIFSQYYNSSLPKEEKIDIFDENHEINEDSIPDFINFCHARTITLTKENSPTLLYLSQKFKVPSLLSQAKEFISAHQKEVVVDILTMYQNDDIFNLAEYEEVISKDLVKYVQDDRLLTLPIQTLHRIVTKYLLHYRTINNSGQCPGQPSELVEFLFKCIDHFGRPASVLFDQIDMFGSSGNLINRLLDSYSEKFDFNFVNTGNLQTVFQLEKEIIAREKEIKKHFSDSKQELLTMSKQIGEKLEVMKKQRLEELNDKKEMFVQIPKMVAQEIEEMKKQHQEEMNDKKEMFVQEMEKMKKQHQEEMKERDKMIGNLIKQFEAVQANYREELHRQNEDFNEKLRKINEQLEKLTQPKITKLYENKFGLISLLGDDVTISSEKHDHSSIKVSNLRKYNDDNFYNGNGATPTSERDTIIKFDLGSHKRFDLHSYFIRTGGDGPNFDHQKTWRIEGSNDDNSWTNLDSRSNDGSLNGKFKECNFICQHGNYGNISNLFRYIRYIQQESWNPNRNYDVDITYFELYGSVVTI